VNGTSHRERYLLHAKASKFEYDYSYIPDNINEEFVFKNFTSPRRIFILQIIFADGFTIRVNKIITFLSDWTMFIYYSYETSETFTLKLFENPCLFIRDILKWVKRNILNEGHLSFEEEMKIRVKRIKFY
jgi:hypothetical protein